jgi:hypothetical protein
MRAAALFVPLLLAGAGCTPLRKGSEPGWEPGSPEQGGPAVETPVPRASAPPSPPPVAPAPPPEPPADVALPAREDPTSPPDAATDSARDAVPEPSAPDGGAGAGCAASGTLGQSCGACGGRITCDGTCSRPTPPDYGEVRVDGVEVLERTGNRSPRSGEWIGHDCPSGHVGAGCIVEVSRTGSDSPLASGCYVVSEGRGCRCKIRWWADAVTTLRCSVTLLSRRACDQPGREPASAPAVR